MDEWIGGWIEDTPYFSRGDSWGNLERDYVLHDNSLVYDSGGRRMELLRVVGKAFVFDPLRLLECSKLFGATRTPWSSTEGLFVNGKSVSGPSFVEVWSSLDGAFWGEARIMGRNFGGGERTEKFEVKSLEEAAGLCFRNVSAPPRRVEELVDVLPDSFPRKPWDKRARPNNAHWGQLKLFLAEMRFLMSGSGPRLLVYAGAASGNHIPLLAKMFPSVLFVLFDPAKFAIKPSANVVVRNEFFTDETAREFAGAGAWFVSDIRLTEEDPAKFEERVHLDNESAKRWIEIMRPVKSSLKFRFPFGWEGPYPFLDGEVHVQQFAPSLSAETRLWTTGGKKDWDPTEHEEKMFYFNTEYRNKGFLDHGPHGLNYDITSLLSLAKEFVGEESALAFVLDFEKEVGGRSALAPILSRPVPTENVPPTDTGLPPHQGWETQRRRRRNPRAGRRPPERSRER